MNLAIRLGEFTKCQTEQEVKELIKSFRGAFYTYIITKIQSRGNKHKLVPIYVGKGKKLRCLSHAKKEEKFQFEHELFYFLRPAKSDKFARDLETAIVAHFGRIVDGGTLVNEKKKGGLSRASVVTTSIFKSRAKQVHGDKYGYSKVEYTGCKAKVEIICKKHGSFWQQPDNHLQGKGCPECAKDLCSSLYSSNTEEYLTKAKQVHGNLYDYSKVKYVNTWTKIEIVCKKHGSFWQGAGSHLRGAGCPKCKGLCDTSQFIEEANKVHKSKYDYSKAIYSGTGVKVEIICPTHGSFWQSPGSHIGGCGCPYCARNIRKTTEQFIIEAKQVHGNQYDYSKVDYKTARLYVEILCKEHDSFLQTPDSHLRGSGCPTCGLRRC